MQDINNFANLVEVKARTFDRLREAMMQIEVPVTVIEMGIMPTGLYYAFLKADRPAKRVPKARKPGKTEIVDNSIKPS
jgi:hypothetical protein